MIVGVIVRSGSSRWGRAKEAEAPARGRRGRSTALLVGLGGRVARSWRVAVGSEKEFGG